MPLFTTIAVSLPVFHTCQQGDLHVYFITERNLATAAAGVPRFNTTTKRQNSSVQFFPSFQISGHFFFASMILSAGVIRRSSSFASEIKSKCPVYANNRCELRGNNETDHSPAPRLPTFEPFFDTNHAQYQMESEIFVRMPTINILIKTINKREHNLRPR